MIKDYKKFILRIITGLILGGLFLASVFIQKNIFYFMVIVFQILASVELKKLFPDKIDLYYWIILTLWLDSMIFVNIKKYELISNLSDFNTELFSIFSLCLIVILLIFIIKEILSNKNSTNEIVFEKITKNVFLYFYFMGSLSLSLILFEIKSGLFFLLVVVVNYSHDIFAYFVGKSIGKNSFFSNISPSKTLEGYIAGVLFSFLIGLILILNTDIKSLGIVKMIILVSSISILCAFGDLFESLIKRITNVKESGKLIPGHGGVLDRLDSLIFSVFLASLVYLLIPTL